MSKLATGALRRPVRLLTTALVAAVAVSMSLLATPAEAATVASKTPTTYTHPVLGERSATVKGLQKRLYKAGSLQKFDNVDSHYGKATTTAVKRFQKAQHLKVTGKVDKKTWKRLVARTGSIDTVTSSKVKAMPKRCKVKGRVLCIDKKSDTLSYLVDGNLVRTMDARFGCSATRTREGTFEIFRKSRDWVSTIYGSSMPFSMFFSGGQAVHYSSDFAARGYAGCSHGCVNIRDWDKLEYLFSKMKVGDRVVVYRAS